MAVVKTETKNMQQAKPKPEPTVKTERTAHAFVCLCTYIAVHSCNRPT